MTHGTTSILVREHELILKVLDALEGYASLVERADPMHPQDGRAFVEFFREFTDACHHGKEEDILFAAMVDAGFPSESGPLGVMRGEHGRGRRLVRQLRDLADRVVEWTDEDRESFAGAAHTFAALLREHIRKEDEVLYPMAETHLTSEQLRRVDELFRLFEEQRMGRGVHERLHGLAEQLIERYAPLAPVEPEERMRSVPSCCGL
jgi:hemerythrin-like domain-containing protein